MSEHLTPSQQHALITHSLERGALLNSLQHLATCEDCRAQVSELRAPARAGEAVAQWAPAHLEYEQLSAYVTGRLDSVTREIAENHLAACAMCAAALHELTQLELELAELLTNRPESHQLTWWKRWHVKWIEPVFAAWSGTTIGFNGWPLGALAGGALLVLLSFGGWQLWRTASSGESSRSAQLTSASPAPTVMMSASPMITRPLSTNAVGAATGERLALLDQGQSIGLDSTGKLLGANDWPPALTSAVARTLKQQQVTLPTTLNELAMTTSTLKGNAETAASFKLHAPLGVVLENDRPVFRWQAVPHAASYQVAVFDQDFNEVLTSPAVTGTTWQASQALPRGKTYLWQVTAQIGDRQITAPQAPAPEARFQILNQGKWLELRQAKRQFGSSHLLLGTLYAEAGLLEDATREFQALQAENPQAPIVKKWLAQVRRAR